MSDEVTVNVSIRPDVAPYVAGTLNAVEQAVTAMEALWPHLNGAFTSASAGWPYMTQAQREAFWAGSPNLSRAYALKARLETLLATMPDLEGSNGSH